MAKRMNRTKRVNKTKRTQRTQRTKRVKRSGKTRFRHRKIQRGGVAPITAPTTILTPEEQSHIFSFPLIDNFKNDMMFLDSRTPYLNTSL